MSLVQKRIQQFFTRHLNNFRHALAYYDALPQLTLLGLLVGLFTGGIIIIFRYLIENPLSLLVSEHSDNFESLTISDRFLFIFSGLLLLAILLKIAGAKHSETSVTHVLDRLHNHQGRMPVSNWLVQFFAAIIALVSGQSVGREGPAVHLGAGAASQLGQWLKLPNNSMQTLIGCGVAAAIAASFDTPMAGVIFAIEVIVMEYSMVGFVPIILASVVGTVLSQAVFGKSGLIVIGTSGIHSLLELPYMVVIGLILALCASLFIRLTLYTMRFQRHSIYLRLLAAGCITACAATFAPEIMGLGYDTINSAIAGHLVIGALLLVGITKLLVTPVVISLGIPGGTIGPLLVIGACIGGAMGLLLHNLFPQLITSPGFYVILGMTGMMAATLNAPQAALVAVLELSYNPNMIFPAMLVIVIACVSTRQIFRYNSLFIEQLNYSNRYLDLNPARLALRRAGVHSIMDTRFATVPRQVTKEEINAILINNPRWLIFDVDNQKTALHAADLAAYITQLHQDPKNTEVPAEFDLQELPGRRTNLLPIHDTANLMEALEYIQKSGVESLYVSTTFSPLTGNVQGIITRLDIENYYQPKEFKHDAID